MEGNVGRPTQNIQPASHSKTEALMERIRVAQEYSHASKDIVAQKNDNASH